MFCRNCGKEVPQSAAACPGCGVPPLSQKKFCRNCGTETQPIQAMCLKCGAGLAQPGPNEKKILAGILGILLGSLGIHKFILGYTREGVIMILITLVGGICTCGAASGVMHIIGIIEGVIYLTKSDEEFEQAYVHNKKGWF